MVRRLSILACAAGLVGTCCGVQHLRGVSDTPGALDGPRALGIHVDIGGTDVSISPEDGIVIGGQDGVRINGDGIHVGQGVTGSGGASVDVGGDNGVVVNAGNGSTSSSSSPVWTNPPSTSGGGTAPSGSAPAGSSGDSVWTKPAPTPATGGQQGAAPATGGASSSPVWTNPGPAPAPAPAPAPVAPAPVAPAPSVPGGVIDHSDHSTPKPAASGPASTPTPAAGAAGAGAQGKPPSTPATSGPSNNPDTPDAAAPAVSTSGGVATMPSGAGPGQGPVSISNLTCETLGPRDVRAEPSCVTALPDFYHNTTARAYEAMSPKQRKSLLDTFCGTACGRVYTAEILGQQLQCPATTSIELATTTGFQATADFAPAFPGLVLGCMKDPKDNVFCGLKRGGSFADTADCSFFYSCCYAELAQAKRMSNMEKSSVEAACPGAHAYLAKGVCGN